MKIFQFFSANLLEIDQSQFKNSNYDVLLSTWLVSIEICHRGIFIFFWHLLVQIKVHKEHIGTKRETLMLIQNLAKYLRWSCLRKCLQHQPPEVFCKKSVPRNFSKFTEKHLCRSLLFKKETLAQVFSWEFWEISKNTLFTKHLLLYFCT